MGKNKNLARAAGRVAWIATNFVLMTGLLITARAAEPPSEPQPPQAAAPEVVDVEVFHGARILTAPGSNAYPVSEVLDGREGWVQLNMMIDPKGKPYEAMVVNSSGNPAFEKAAMKSLKLMSFEPARRGDTPIDSSFTMKMKFAIQNMANGASSDFISAYRRFTKAIEAGDKAAADAQLAKLNAQNLYEDAFENYGKYFYHHKWGTPAEELTDLRLAIAGEKRPEYLPKQAFRDALVAMFALEVKAVDYGGALGTWAVLEPIVPATMRADLQHVVDKIHAFRVSSQPVSLSATIDDTSNWHSTLFRNRFSIGVTSGAVSEIKLRCEKQYLFFTYQPGLQYSIGARKDHCGIEVVGDPGTRFDLIQ